ncbi:MAG TPA: hypothetical protein VIW70_12465 [Rubrivivax sp.]
MTEPRLGSAASQASSFGPPAGKVTDAAGVDMAQVAGHLGGEIASPLSSAIERVNALATTGRIDRAGLVALRGEIEIARRAGIIAQQLARLAGGGIRQNAERLDLTQLLREAVSQRGREIQARGIEVRQVLQPAEVVADAALVFALLQALLDWSLAHAQQRVELTLDIRSWPVNARLRCHFRHRAPDLVDAHVPAAAPQLDTMAWLLVRQTALSLGLEAQRRDSGGEATLTLEFPRTVNGTVNEMMAGVSAIELDDDLSLLPNSKPLAGSHVLVVSGRREVRAVVRDAIRPMGLMVDFTTSVDEAREFCRGGLPHAIVYEAALGGESFELLRRELLAEVPLLSFIAIAEEGHAYESSLRDGFQTTRVGRNALMTALPSALLFELSRGVPT